MVVPRSISQLGTPRAYLTGGGLKLTDLFAYACTVTSGKYNIVRYHKEIKSLLGVETVFSYASGRAALMEILSCHRNMRRR